VYHAGVELKIFEGVTSCTAAVRAGSSAELLEKLMQVPLVRCDQVQWSFLGVSMAGWNAIVSLAGAASIAALTLSRRRA
jgi:disulfide bond formation protein DsbB